MIPRKPLIDHCRGPIFRVKFRQLSCSAGNTDQRKAFKMRGSTFPPINGLSPRQACHCHSSSMLLKASIRTSPLGSLTKPKYVARSALNDIRRREGQDIRKSLATSRAWSESLHPAGPSSTVWSIRRSVSSSVS